MDEVAFSDWPGQPVDLNSGNNPWMPAYGFQTPSTLLDKEDFIGNPDAEYFLHDNVGQYMYLETILEETSDDLCSEESDYESRGWLATDSETGSVICIDAPDDVECESDREIACPAKRRKHDFFLTLPNAEEDLSSLSRSSSLLQFESLEKQCQEICSSSPSIYSQYSFDSLDHNNSNSLNSPSTEDETDYYKTLKIDVPMKKQTREGPSYNAFRYSGSDSSDSDATLDTSRSSDNLKTWKSYENLRNNPRGVREKASVENLSEDSGYSDHLTKSSSTNNLKEKLVLELRTMKNHPEKRNSYVGFSAYDGEFLQDNFSGNFGVSYQDLTSFKDNQLDSLKTSPLIDHFNSRKQRSHFTNDISDVVTKILKLDTHQECDRKSNFKSSFPSTSEPNLLQTGSESIGANTVCVSSVPKDLNFISEFNKSATRVAIDSVAAKDWNLADLCFDFSQENNDIDVVGEEDTDNMSHYKREGSYSEAMSNRVDLSDDEYSLYNKRKPKLPKTPIVEFDKRVLKAISEQSLQSILSSSQNLVQNDSFLDEAYTSTPISTKQRSVASTPNLAVADQLEQTQKYFEEERRKSVHDVRRKGSIIKSSTSTSGMSDGEDKTLMSVKSFSGSSNSKGVHFSPVVSEVNWRDDSVSTVTPDRESSYSLGSSSPERRRSPPKEIVKPQPRFATPSRLSYSQPDLSDNDSCRREFVDSLKNLRDDTMSKSQPDVNRLRRRGSQLIKKDKDGSVIKAYVDGDGIQYKHTHLDIGIGFGPHHPEKSAEAGGKNRTGAEPVGDMQAQDTFRRAEHARKDVAAKRPKASGKIGGFFSRLANFRFSLKKGVEEKAKKKGAGSNAALPNQHHQQRVATKDDYIYIPLKGPPTTAASTVTAKPPLPRVVHASAKTPLPAQAPPPRAARSQRRRTIDGAAAAVPMEPAGLIETDLDTEVTVITGGCDAARARSLLDLGGRPARPLTAAVAHGGDGAARPHKSMEFLLDKQNLRVVEPPENELQKGERVMSEHQLRVQRSLQKLTIPDWYKHSHVPREGFLLKKQPPRDSRWSGTGGTKTTSLSSLGSANNSSLTLSPTPLNQPFVRWSTSKLNSTASSPCASTRSSFNAKQPNGSISPSSARSSFSYRQPYMGWRSQERLSRPRTPAERLASSLLSSHSQPQGSPEIQTSIKEVTSAIVHYVSGLRPEDAREKSQETASNRSSSASPRGSQKFCWLESSFVGTRPPDSPETPVAVEDSQRHAPVAPASLRLDLQNHNDATALMTSGTTVKPSPNSTTLEDVLDSLLGLPTTGRAPSPSLQETVSANTSPCRQGQPEEPTEQFRRRSEGSEPVAVTLSDSRRSSLNCPPVVRCRYSRCGKTTVASSPAASSFKNCHNCSYTYCSRTCRRAHWEKHRKTCLFSRIGTLCRQVIAAAKENKDTLTHLSQISRRGYLSHGHGAVKCFFPNPEAAEKFLTEGLAGLGELTFVRWQDLLPSEMGPQMYAELMKMCKNYNADTKFVLYVSVCVISETPATGSVKWERQLVSRCAKMRLSRVLQIPEREPTEHPETLILTSAPIEEDRFRVKELRQVSVDHLQSHLRFRGVSLKYQYPEIFKQLDAYCSDPTVKFTPLTVYPKDSLTGKNLMCIIMLEADEESLKEVENAGVRVRTVDLMKDVCVD